MAIEERSFTTIQAAAHTLADNLASTLRDAISDRGSALLAVSGGRTPQYVFHRLRYLDVDWGRVKLTLTDERCVPSDHSDSNEKLVRSYLLQGPVTAATFIPLFRGEDSPEDRQSACEARLRAMELPFDAVYIGMGSDGHFASLFPGDPAVDIRNRLCVAVPATGPRLPRVTLSAPAILDARKIFLLFSGADKHMLYGEAKRTGSYKDIPLRLILSQEQTPVYVLNSP